MAILAAVGGDGAAHPPRAAARSQPPQSAKRVLSQLKRIARALWSNPPTHGARIAAEVVGDPGMFEQWKAEMAGKRPRGRARCRKTCTPDSERDACNTDLTCRTAERRKAARTTPGSGCAAALGPSPCATAAPATNRTRPLPAPGMAGRIAKVRGELRAALEKRMPDKDWSFVTKQIGMFSYTGMSPAQVRYIICAGLVCRWLVWGSGTVCIRRHQCHWRSLEGPVLNGRGFQSVAPLTAPSLTPQNPRWTT